MQAYRALAHSLVLFLYGMALFEGLEKDPQKIGRQFNGISE